MQIGKLRGDDINWNQVFYFSEIAAAGSVKAAAEKLELSPSTLSEHLSQLESELDLKLFHRQHRKLSLTEEGARLFQCARQMFEMGKRFMDAISPKPMGCYPVSIGMVPGAAYSFAHKVIAEYIQHHVDVSAHIIRVQHDEVTSNLLEGKLDFAFTDRRVDRDDLVQSPVIVSDLRFFVGRNIVGNDLKELLTKVPLVVCRSGRGVPSAVEEVLEALDIIPSRTVVSDYPSLVETLCRRGVGVAILGKLHFADDPEVRMLDLPSGVPDFKERLYVTWAHDAENSTAVQRLKMLMSRTL